MAYRKRPTPHVDGSRLITVALAEHRLDSTTHYLDSKMALCITSPLQLGCRPPVGPHAAMDRRVMTRFRHMPGQLKTRI